MAEGGAHRRATVMSPPARAGVVARAFGGGAGGVACAVVAARKGFAVLGVLGVERGWEFAVAFDSRAPAF